MPITNEHVVILAEIKPGIDLTSTDLIGGPGEYWLPDESGVVTTTGYEGVISGNMWTANAGVTETVSTGTDSEYWEFDGTVMQTVV